ncbi:MAG: hypothetical protein ACI4VP_06460 [Clostridia bacterium]
MSNFTNNIKVKEKEIYGKPESKFNCEMDIYRQLIDESLHGFIKFMEAINSAITVLEENLVMSNVEFKARIKDAIGTVRNSDKKALDDIFGFELITPNETDKEILMLLIHKIYDEKICRRENNHNKSNGYHAHHRVGVLKNQFTGYEFENIESYILSAKTKRLKTEYRDLSRKTQLQMPTDELYEEIYLYPHLREQIIQEGCLEKTIVDTLKTTLTVIKEQVEDTSDIPAVEVQFKTSSVAEEAVFGKARHNKYKPVDSQEIINSYNNRKLMRGMHFPFKFYRDNGKMKLQPTSTTLVEMYPFLREPIINFNKNHPNALASYDMYFATIFPELKNYVKELSKKEPCLKVRNTNKDAIWKILKLKALNPDFSIPDYVAQKKQMKGEQAK